MGKLEHENYEFSIENYESPGMKRTQERLTLRAIELLGAEKGAVLDIGCGSGFSMHVLEQTGFKVKGIDPSKELLTKAKERGFTVREGTFENIPYKTKFDYVISISALQWADYTKSAKEVNRVARKGGIIQFYPDDERAMIKAAKAFAKYFEVQIAIDAPDVKRKKKVFLILRRL